MAYIFNTKFSDLFDRNGQEVEVLEYKKGRDVFCDRYIVQFKDGLEAEVTGLEFEERRDYS